MGKNSNKILQYPQLNSTRGSAAPLDRGLWGPLDFDNRAHRLVVTSLSTKTIRGKNDNQILQCPGLNSTGDIPVRTPGKAALSHLVFK